MLPTRAAYVSQRCAFEYCRVKASFDWYHLVKEPEFAASMEVCRWEAYAAVASDLGIMLEGLLRPHMAGQSEPLLHFMQDCFEYALGCYPPPAHRSDGWRGDIEAFRLRVAQAQLAQPRPVHLLGVESGARIFKHLPIHPRLRGHDAEMITNNVRFNLCRTHEDLLRSVDFAAVAGLLRSGRDAQTLAEA